MAVAPAPTLIDTFTINCKKKTLKINTIYSKYFEDIPITSPTS